MIRTAISMRLETVKQGLMSALAIACITWSFGCSPKFIVHMDGYPSPEEINVAWSHDGSITAKWFFSRWFMKRIESKGYSENIAYPEYLLFDIRNILPSDTSNVVINLQIYNPGMKKYRLVKLVTVGGRIEEEQIGGWTIRDVQHAFIPGPAMAGEEIGLSVKIILEEDGGSSEQVLSTGELSYIIEPSKRDDPVRRKGGDS